MKKNILILLLVLAMGLWTAGCAFTGNDGGEEEQQAGTEQTQTEQVATGQETPENPSAEALADQAEVKLYYISSAYVFDGNDPVNGEMMPPIAGTVSRGSYATIYMATVQALRALNPIPEDQAEHYYTMLRENYKVNSVNVEDGIAYVDFASEGLTGGDLDEVLLVDQIVYTLCNSFTEIDAVKFTVDGKNATSLMGSVDITEPIVADYL
ncbi:MAG: GerMN domain-containing protein [Firmicutes bacterium]|jgi:hypothetical protein|nr:GerMN domain-containing protein [Bacillota bacterium]